MENPDEAMSRETEFPVPPTYERAEEIQEFDASGQLVTTVTVLRGSLVKHVGYTYGDASLLPNEYLVKYPESRINISVSCISTVVDMRVFWGVDIGFQCAWELMAYRSQRGRTHG